MLAGLALAVLTNGCDEAYEPPSPTSEELAAAAALVQASASATPSLDEPHDDSIEACVERLATATPPSVRRTIDVIGYTEFFVDTCRTRIAEEERDPAPCASIETRLVRNGCLVRTSIAARSPDTCPAGSHGRDPLCVALAARSLALCEAAPHLEREACHALLGDASHGCETSIAPELCEAIVTRHRGVIGDATGDVVPRERTGTALEVRLARVRSGQPPEPIGEPLSLDTFARGARIHADDGRLVLELADPLGISALSHAEHASVAIEVPLPPAHADADDERLDVDVVPVGHTEGARLEIYVPELGARRASDGEVHLTHLARTLGGRVEGRFVATAPLDGDALRIEGTFRTFVRDVASAAPTGSLADQLDGLEPHE